jgi:hypothetical protein
MAHHRDHFSGFGVTAYHSAGEEALIKQSTQI